MRIIVGFGGFVAGCLATFFAFSASADPLQLRIGWATTPTHVQPLIDELRPETLHPEIFPHFGQSYVAGGMRFDGSTPQIQALAINELEILRWPLPHRRPWRSRSTMRISTCELSPTSFRTACLATAPCAMSC